MSDPLLETRRLSRSFGALAAVREVDFRLATDPARANRVPLPLLWQGLESYRALHRAPL